MARQWRSVPGSDGNNSILSFNLIAIFLKSNFNARLAQIRSSCSSSETIKNHRDDKFVFQGVRYTALQGEVEQERIAEILNRFFGARTATS